VKLSSLVAGLLILALPVATGCGSRPGGMAIVETGNGSVSVRVVFGTEPAPGAIVQLLDAQQSPVGEMRTDETGTAIFKGIPGGSGYQAIATLEGITGTAADIVVAGGETKTTVVLSQRSGPVGLVVGSVKLAGADKPLANAVIEVSGKKATTDANGQFRMEGVPAGPATVKATLGGYGSTSEAIVVKPGSSSAIALSLQPLSTGPRAGHTLVATTGKVLEFDAWHNTVTTYSASQAWSATFLNDGGVLVADAGANKAIEYGEGGSKRGTYSAPSIGNLWLGALKDPKGATRTSSGTVLVADTGHNRIVEIDSSNRIVWEFKNGLSAPRWAERLPKGNILIADTGNNRVIEINTSGSVVWGVGDGSTDVLNQPTTAQRLANGNTLVCDAGNNRVMEVNSQNQLVWIVPGRGNAGSLNNPNSARRLPTGNTLIADTDGNQVVELSPEGNVVWKQPVQQPLFADRF
jgi:sugar lactone lactonase YvrE